MDISSYLANLSEYIRSDEFDFDLFDILEPNALIADKVTREEYQNAASLLLRNVFTSHFRKNYTKLPSSWEEHAVTYRTLGALCHKARLRLQTRRYPTNDPSGIFIFTLGLYAYQDSDAAAIDWIQAELGVLVAQLAQAFVFKKGLSNSKHEAQNTQTKTPALHPAKNFSNIQVASSQRPTLVCAPSQTQAHRKRYRSKDYYRHNEPATKRRRRDY
ncbi:hypothetical protein H0H87_004563 [Tephrocybe sp. NHM501043]|nr:hypothetical protein H0H87_004563 [Tephrocybe sp. NHM501043]